MKNVIYICTIGAPSQSADPKEPKEIKIPNIGPFQSGISSFPTNIIQKVYILSDSPEEILRQKIFSLFPLLKDKIEFKATAPFDYKNVMNAVLQIGRLYDSQPLTFVINLTGGTKVMALGAFMGANLIGARIQYVKEDRRSGFDFVPGEIIDIKMPSIPLNQLHAIQKVILYVLNDEQKNRNSLTQTQLKQKINTKHWRKYMEKAITNDVSSQLVSYHCEILEREDYLVRSHDDANRRAYILTLTEMGTILANYLMKEL